MIETGKLTQRLNLYAATTTKSLSGAPIAAITRMGGAWAELVIGRADTATSQDRDRAVGVYQFRVRWLTTAPDWVNWRGKWFRVTGVDDTDSHRAQMLITGDLTDAPPTIKAQP
ncbi:head-tail adaptor protein [Motilimonas cestriensis]|uniref:Head-tail adaptor protein n=1 Tax=Motilimonas cestriensis TaxID=2742685 RepID=A0ABS8WDT9_9GAMM|nr:head-tail adaptor protein [Motilimonas cestriensis]MCE2597204.1 head-tail adaptor protein [Motilimonas cestriensis]